MAGERRTKVIIFMTPDWVGEATSATDPTLLVENIQVVLMKYGQGDYAVVSPAYEPGVRAAEVVIRVLGVAHVAQTLGKDPRHKSNIRQMWSAILAEKSAEYIFVVAAEAAVLAQNQPEDCPEGVEIMSFPLDKLPDR